MRALRNTSTEIPQVSLAPARRNRRISRLCRSNYQLFGGITEKILVTSLRVLLCFTGGARGGGRSSKVLKRAKPLDPEDDYYYDDPVDERNNPTNEAPAVPPGFLSPSVREYLDLGKSIPGT